VKIRVTKWAWAFSSPPSNPSQDKSALAMSAEIHKFQPEINSDSKIEGKREIQASYARRMETHPAAQPEPM
jgi:hypothetical protein